MSADSDSRRAEGFLAKCNRRLRNVAITALVILSAIVAVAHYLMLQMDEQIRAHVERVLTEANPHLVVRVKRARRLNSSIIEVRGLSLSHRYEKSPFMMIDEAQIACNTDLRHLLRQQTLEIEAIRLNRPHVRARIASDGTCDLTKLAEMAKTSGDAAPVQIHDGAIELVVDGEGEQRRIQLRDVYLRVEHHSATKEQGPSVRIHGSYSGDHVTHATFDFRRDASTGAWSVQGEVDHLGFSESLLASLPQVAAESRSRALDADGLDTMGWAPPAQVGLGRLIC